MITSCPHCSKPIKFSGKQLGMLQKALKGLKPGKTLTIKCPHCKKPIQLDAKGNVANSSAKPQAKQKAKPPASAKPKEKKKPTPSSDVKPPPPPDLDWLRGGEIHVEEKVRDVPMALVLCNEDKVKNKLKAAMETLGYRALTAKTSEDAISQTRFVTFACIVLHSGFEPGGLEESEFHNYMCQMAMKTRRYVYYILYGEQFHSLYDMEALAYSANLVVSEQDIEFFDLILHKAIPAYEELFGPFLEEIGNYGSK